jgi:uncharacterized protein YprB with RNaseH-like and TPR domain
MSGLKDRLRRYVGQNTGSASNPEGDSAPGGEIAERHAPEEPVLVIEAESDAPLLPTTDESLREWEESLDPQWDKLEAFLVHTEAGDFIRRSLSYPADYVHGSCRLADLYRYAGELLAFTQETDGGPVHAEELVFFDTETTGLGHGAGNVAFMVGLGYWQSGTFVVEQLFIRNPSEELAMLSYLKKKLEGFRFMVSYNGKSFDWPLLQTRFVMHRMRGPEPEPYHLDFLYASRSLWRHTLPSCKLGKVEETQLDFVREDDVPGSMAPALYFLYLAEKKPGSIAPVFEHNGLDILSLAGLAVLFAKALQGEYNSVSRVPEEQFRYGLWLSRMGCGRLAGVTMDHLVHYVLLEGEEGAAYQYLATPLAAYYKQQGHWEQAVALWGKAITNGKEVPSSVGPSLIPYIEMAMYCEHRQKNYEDALMYADEALLWAEERHRLLQAASKRAAGRAKASKRKGSIPLEEELLELAGAADKAGKPDKAGEMAKELQKRTERLRKKLQRSGLTGRYAGEEQAEA